MNKLKLFLLVPLITFIFHIFRDAVSALICPSWELNINGVILSLDPQLNDHIRLLTGYGQTFTTGMAPWWT